MRRLFCFNAGGPVAFESLFRRGSALASLKFSTFVIVRETTLAFPTSVMVWPRAAMSCVRAMLLNVV